MSKCWDEHGLYKDDTPFSGGAIYEARFRIPIHHQQPKKNTHYRVFFQRNDGTISSDREYPIDVMNDYIKRKVASDCGITGYLLCVWINNEYRECRHSQGWDTTTTPSLINGEWEKAISQLCPTK